MIFSVVQHLVTFSSPRGNPVSDARVCAPQRHRLGSSSRWVSSALEDDILKN